MMESTRRGSGVVVMGVLGLAIAIAIVVVISYAFAGPSRYALKSSVTPLLRAQVAFVDHRYEEAEGIVRGVIKVAPGDLKAKGLLGRILLKRGRREEARKIFASILEKDGTHLEALLGLAKVYEGMGQGDLAAIYMRKVAEQRPGEAWVWRELALLQKRTGDVVGAMASAQRSLSIDPDQEILTALMADVSALEAPNPLQGLPGVGNPSAAGNRLPGMPANPGLNQPNIPGQRPGVPGIPRPVVPDPRPKLPGDPRENR